MTVADGKPLVGDSARTLGVRFGDSPSDDIAIDQSGNVQPGTGGMSVAPHWRSLETHRIPKRLRTAAMDATGSNKDACWRMGEGPFVDANVAEALQLTVDSEIHGIVGPDHTLSQGQFRTALAATRDIWFIDES